MAPTPPGPCDGVGTPGYVVRLAGQPSVPPPAAGVCVVCRRPRRRGRDYLYYAAHVEGMSYQVVHQESAFVCDACAKDDLDIDVGYAIARLVIAKLFWAQVALLSAALLGRAVTLAVLVAGAIRVVRAFRHLRACLAHPGLDDDSAAHEVTRLAIRCRRRAVLKALGLPEARVAFLSCTEHFARMKPRPQAVSRPPDVLDAEASRADHIRASALALVVADASRNDSRRAGRVQGNGPGLSPEVLPRLYEP